jgi:hypothetical protein
MVNLLALPWYLNLALAMLTALAIGFLIWFCVPALRVGSHLSRVLKRLNGPPDSVDLSSIFESYPTLKHLWSEFRETLHAERSPNPRTGMAETTSLRATVPAEAFFTEDTIVNTPLRSEFFKHLPGIFTGIGIIGTFTGLLLGMKAFRVTEDPGVVRRSLEDLLHGVSEAFLVSATAILLAMLVTFIEKVVLVRLYRKVQRLTQAIDERFKAGVGEEYLARLVKASEESATQGKTLKDALVGDLKAILTDLTEKQIAAISSSHQRLGSTLGEAVAGHLKQPLERLASAAETVRGDQSVAVQQLLSDLLADFSSRLESLFGGQMSGMQQMQQQAAAALSDAAQQLRQMSATVEGAGQRASQTLMERLEQTLHKLDQRQLVMNEEFRKFVQEIRTSLGQSQSESHQQLKKLLQELADSTGVVVRDLTQKSQAVVGEMGIHADNLAGKITDAIGHIGGAVVRIEKVTSDAIVGMNAGAETLAIAAGDFARAGQGISGTLNLAQGLSGQLMQSASSLTSASHTMETLLVDYKATRDGISTMLHAVQAAVESAKKEASFTADVLQKLDAASGRLVAAQKAADEYLQQVTDVLTTSHKAFADAVNRSLNEGNKDFHTQLSNATGMLRQTVQELESALFPVTARAAGR